jgi:hypothetical protein
MNLQVLDLVGQKKRIGHELVILREKALKARDDDTKDVLLREMLQILD